MITLEESYKKKNYEYLLSITYEKAIFHLLNKYGIAFDDYFKEHSYTRFLQGKIKTIARGRYKRTLEGLYCHHIDENKYENLSNLDYIKTFKYPFKYQKKERLVYCDLFEHLILHALIIKETQARFGLSGYEAYLYPIAEEWFIKQKNPKPDWMKECKKRAFLNQKDAKELLNKINEFIKPLKEAHFAITEVEIQKWKAANFGMSISEYEEYLIRKNKEEEEHLRLKEQKKLNEFNKKYPKLQKININVKTPRKKILDCLYDRNHNKDSLKRKEFYKEKIALTREELLQELNDIL